MESKISRRDFIKLGGASMGALGFRPPEPDRAANSDKLVRVATTYINVYSEPSFRSNRLGRQKRDEIISVIGEELSDLGPRHNPRWFQIPGAYLHSGYLQEVEWLPQKPMDYVSPHGSLFEVSVPYTRAYRAPDPASDPLYRLYYQSTAWAVESVIGADGRRWYRLEDDLLHLHYYARSEHLRFVSRNELMPISPEIPLHLKSIEVSLARQELLAYEENRLVLRTSISSGIPDPEPRENGIPTITPKGRFYVDKKMPLRHMGDGVITADLEAYELPGVPWVLFFYETGVAFHGTYWHTNYGTPMSHGCVNMRPEEAKWLYRWTLPEIKHADTISVGHGTSVNVA